MAKKEREYSIRGRLALNGVQFFVRAESAESAERKARAGLWYSYDTDGAEAADYTMTGDAELNE